MNKPVVHFAHANGFPSSTYGYLFELLNDVDIYSVEALGHGRFKLDGDWRNLADEVIDSVQRQADKPVIGVGHSLGGVVTLLAAAKRPDLFEQVILLDPVIFSKRKRYAVSLVRTIGMGDYIGPIKRTLVRKSRFDSHQQAHQYFSGKSLFRNFHPRCLDDYVKHGLQANGEDLELVFSPQVEADIFRTLLTKVPKAIAKVKGVIVYGETSDVVHASDVRWWQRHLPNFEFVKAQGGHLFVQENPEKTAELLSQLIHQ